MANKKQKLIILGRLGASYGVKGWIKINSFTENPTDIFNYKTVLIQTQFGVKVAHLEDWKHHSNHLICKLDIIHTMEEAKEFNNCNVAVKPEELPELTNGEVYWNDLLGCKVQTTDGYFLGIVKSIMETGANDVLVLSVPIDDKFNKKERLIPYDPDQVITNINISHKIITVDWNPDF